MQKKLVQTWNYFKNYKQESEYKNNIKIINTIKLYEINARINIIYNKYLQYYVYNGVPL